MKTIARHGKKKAARRTMTRRWILADKARPELLIRKSFLFGMTNTDRVDLETKLKGRAETNCRRTITAFCAKLPGKSCSRSGWGRRYLGKNNCISLPGKRPEKGQL